MQIPIRVIGIATSVFWAFLIIFSVTAAYSMKDFQFSLGQPQVGETQDDELPFFFPVSIVNKGFYNIANLNISTDVVDKEGERITRGSTFISVIEHGQAVDTNHTLTLNLTDLLHRSRDFLLTDTELTINAMMEMDAAEVVPVQASWNFTMPWGAPLSGFALGSPQFAPYNTTHVTATVRVSFQNHACFDVVGALQLKIYVDNVFLSQSQTRVEALQSSAYEGSVDLVVPLSTTSAVRFEALLATQFFDYGPLVILYG